MINKITLVGNAGQDPETRKLENGTSVAKVSLATKESWKDKEGNWKDSTEWHTLLMWGEKAERATQIKKGSLVFVEGKITYRKYKDKEDVERSVTEIVVSSFRVLDKKEGNAKETGVPVEDGMGGSLLDDDGTLPF